VRDYLTTFRYLEIEKCTEEYSYNFLRVKMRESYVRGDTRIERLDDVF
jgi:hypothetical protein